MNYLNTYLPKGSVCVLVSAAAGLNFVTVKAADLSFLNYDSTSYTTLEIGKTRMLLT